MSNVRCPTYDVQRTMSNVRCPTYDVHRTLSTVRCPPYDVHRTMSNVRCPTYDVQRTMSGTCPEMFGTLCGTFGTFLDPGNIVRVQHRALEDPNGWYCFYCRKAFMACPAHELYSVAPPKKWAFGRAKRTCSALKRTCALSCLLYTSPSPRDATLSRMPSSA